MQKRLHEPSTYAGLMGLIVGAGELFDINEAPAVAEVVAGAGQAAVANPTTGGLIQAALIIAAGLTAVFLKEGK